MKQFFIVGNMYDEDIYQQVYVRGAHEPQVKETETEMELLHEKSGVATLIMKSSCLEITEEEYNRLISLEGELAYGREAWNVISSKLVPLG